MGSTRVAECECDRLKVCADERAGMTLVMTRSPGKHPPTSVRCVRFESQS
jgi:hypothetical protein